MTWRTVALSGLLVVVVGAGLYWHRRPPCVTALPAAADQIVDGRAGRYAAVAFGAGRAEGPAGPEVIGNPAADRYPDCASSHARNPWDLIAIQGRLYVGLGDASNEGPSPKAGPVPVYAYEPATHTFWRETTLEEEVASALTLGPPRTQIAGPPQEPEAVRWGDRAGEPGRDEALDLIRVRVWLDKE